MMQNRIITTQAIRCALRLKEYVLYAGFGGPVIYGGIGPKEDGLVGIRPGRLSCSHGPHALFLPADSRLACVVEL